jgi:hypothetical protein
LSSLFGTFRYFNSQTIPEIEVSHVGAYTRPDSPWWWLWLKTAPRGQQKERTTVRVGTTVAQRRDSRRIAEDFYHHRMNELARAAFAHVQTHGTRKPTVLKPLRRSPDGWCYVYIIQQADLVKIGRAVDVNKRLKTLEIGNPGGFQVLATIPAHAAIEGAIQARFKHLRERGEWFRLDPDLAAFIARLQQGANPIALLWE